MQSDGETTSVAEHEAPAAEATTPRAASRCTVRHDDDGWWFVSPSGRKFFSLGICEFNQGVTQEGHDPARPSYSGWKHYESPQHWVAASLQRLKAWNFTTAAGWSDYQLLDSAGKHDLWITPVLSLGAQSGAPWFDMWDDKVVQRIDEVAKESIRPHAGDPRVLGYFSDNELGWWNAIMWKMTLEQPPTSGQRQQLLRVVRETYHDRWDRLLNDFEPDGAGSWDELQKGGKLWLRPGGNGIHTMRRFLAVVAERYYRLMHDAIKKYDPTALYLGDRFQSFYYPQVPHAGRALFDVVSTNLNANWNDGTFLRSYLDSLHKLTGRPVLVSEFYMAAAENRSGNQNSAGIFPAVTTQPERRDAALNTLHALLRLPYVVGADWFQYFDEPTHGRVKDGENYNFGLVDIHNLPYDELTAALASLNANELKSRAIRQARPLGAGIPPAPAEPFANFSHMTGLKNWDRERGFIPAGSSTPVGDLYACWTADALYLGTYVLDVIELEYYKDRQIPEQDRAQWTIQLAGGIPMTLRVGADRAAAITTNDRTIACASSSGIYHKVRCITAVKIPTQLLGKKQFAAGDRIQLNSSFTTFARAERMEWNHELVLAP